MVVDVIGSRYAKGTSKKSGKPYEGFFASIGYDVEGYNGKRCEERFFSLESLGGIKPEPGMKLDLDIGFGGFVNSIHVVQK